MVTVTDAQNEADALSALISSLTSTNQDSVRPQIRTAAMTLAGMLHPLADAANAAAHAATGTSLNSLITWSATAEANLRVKVLAAATSAQPIIGLLSQIVGWHSGLGTVEWNSPPPNLPIGGNSTPETHAGLLITYLASYRAITGT